MATYWDPRRELRELRAQIEQAFRAARHSEQSTRPTGEIMPPVDYTATADAFYIVMDLPGVAKDQVEVNVEEGVLIIRGHKAAGTEKDGRLVRSERAVGPFVRTLPISNDANVEDITARLRNGELEVRIGRRRKPAISRVDITVE